MLEGALWKGAMAVEQYTHTRDPYDYWSYCKALDRQQTTDNGWFNDVARLIICWMAETLQTMGHGRGLDEHFSRTILPAAPPAPPAPAAPTAPAAPAVDPAWETALLDYSEATMDETVVHRPCALPTPPSRNAQRARTLGYNEDLKEFLRTHGSKRHKSSPLDYTTLMLKNIVKTYFETAEGRHLLEACELDADSYSVDHVIPESWGGPDRLWNYHLMPLKHNSAFRNTPHTHPAKQAYVGKDQMALLKAKLLEAKKMLPWQLIQ